MPFVPWSAPGCCQPLVIEVLFDEEFGSLMVTSNQGGLCDAETIDYTTDQSSGTLNEGSDFEASDCNTLIIPNALEAFAPDTDPSTLESLEFFDGNNDPVFPEPWEGSVVVEPPAAAPATPVFVRAYANTFVINPDSSLGDPCDPLTIGVTGVSMLFTQNLSTTAVDGVRITTLNGGVVTKNYSTEPEFFTSAPITGSWQLVNDAADSLGLDGPNVLQSVSVVDDMGTVLATFGPIADELYGVGDHGLVDGENKLTFEFTDPTITAPKSVVINDCDLGYIRYYKSPGPYAGSNPPGTTILSWNTAGTTDPILIQNNTFLTDVLDYVGLEVANTQTHGAYIDVGHPLLNAGEGIQLDYDSAIDELVITSSDPIFDGMPSSPVDLILYETVEAGSGYGISASDFVVDSATQITISDASTKIIGDTLIFMDFQDSSGSVGSWSGSVSVIPD